MPPNRVLYVRVPGELHEELCRIADAVGLSMAQVVITLLCSSVRLPMSEPEDGKLRLITALDR